MPLSEYRATQSGQRFPQRPIEGCHDTGGRRPTIPGRRGTFFSPAKASHHVHHALKRVN